VSRLVSDGGRRGAVSGPHVTRAVGLRPPLVSPERFRFEHALVASVPLHALARRFQRGWDLSDAAVRAALASPRPDVLAAGGEFTVPLPEGCWVGTVAEIEDRSEPARILVVRSYIGADMEARPAVLPGGIVAGPATCLSPAGCGRGSCRRPEPYGEAERPS
jgi:hypothetical protein